MPKRKLLVAVVAFLLLCALSAQTSLLAQDEVRLKEGARVRLTPVSGSTRFEAIVIAVHGDTLTVEQGGVPRVVLLDSLRKLEIGTRHRFDSRRGLQGAGIGALGGAVLAAIALADCGLGSASIGGECRDQNAGESILLVAGAAVGGAVIGGAFEGGGRAARRGALIGAAIGAPIGLVMGLATYEPCPSDAAICFGPVLIAAGAGFGAMAGGFVGLLAGALVPSTDWLEIRGQLIRVSLVPRRHGLALGVTLFF